MAREEKFLLETARRRIKMSEIPFWALLLDIRMSKHSQTFTWMITEQVSPKVKRPYVEMLARRTGCDALVWDEGRPLHKFPEGFTRKVFTGRYPDRTLTFRVLVDVHR